MVAFHGTRDGCTGARTVDGDRPAHDVGVPRGLHVHGRGGEVSPCPSSSSGRTSRVTSANHAAFPLCPCWE